jgi:phosphohistidine swiveling domain-containing protein
MDPEAPNVLHTLSRRASWSRANEKGVFPGVSSPLNWSIWGEIGERAVRRGAFDLGLLDADELAPPDSIDDWGWSIFYGRPSANVDTWRALYERGLGATGQGAATQRQVFGDASASSLGASAGPAVPDGDGRRAREAAARRVEAADERRRAIAERRPVAVATSPDRLRATRAEAIRWWSEATRELAGANASAKAAERRLREALELFERADRDHIVVSLLSTEAVTTLSAVAAAAGRPDAANALMVGYPGMEEFETAVAVWDLSRGRISLAAFLDAHGFHGSMEGEIASRSWREDPAPVRALAERYAKLPEADDPRVREERAVHARSRLEAELRAAVPASEREALDRTFALASTCLPMREAGRATLTIALDAMRAAARVLGRAFAGVGRLGDPEDVFLTTRFELLEPPADLRARVEARRELVEAYACFDLPETWQGMPEKFARIDRQEALRGPRGLAPGDRLEGLGVSAGVHEGTARVVLDPSDPALEFEAGDVLVAPATDPSWAPLFLVAGAVVIETGSNISHAAVVAREMGIPAVVAVRDASLRLRAGQRLRVDGKAGTVEVVADPVSDRAAD